MGEIRLIPDWQTLTPLFYAPGHARVIGNMILDGKTWPLCPRGFLLRMMEAAKNHGLEIQAAFENEFYLVRRIDDGVIATDSTVFAAAQAMDIHREVINDIADALIAQGIPVEQYYPESDLDNRKLPCAILML